MPDNGLPFERPGKIVCVGLNYRDHAEESGMELPQSGQLVVREVAEFADRPRASRSCSRRRRTRSTTRPSSAS